MPSAEDEVSKALHAFYDALDDVLLGRGTRAMNEIWHHRDYVTTAPPFGNWARGWPEVWATWEEAAALYTAYKGHEGRSDRLGDAHDLRVTVLGDVAYATSVYRCKLYMSDGEIQMKVNCTNVLELVDGVWKLVLHHADQAPSEFTAAIGRMIERGHS